MGTFRARPEWWGAVPRPRDTRPGADDSDTEWQQERPHHGNPQRPCGARGRSGRPCGRPMDYGDTICTECAGRVFHAEFRNPRRWGWITSQIGQSELVAARRRAAEETARTEAMAARERAAEREACARHVVYYLRTAPHRLKIGTTGDLPRRLREFRTDGSYLLAVEPGGRELEHQRHVELRRWRVHRRREDYAEGPEVSARIEAVLAEHGDPAGFLRSADKEAM